MKDLLLHGYKPKNLPKQSVTAFLTFSDKTEEDMNLYKKILPSTRIDEINYFSEADIYGYTGKVLSGTLNIKGTKIIFMEIPSKKWLQNLVGQ